MSPTLRRLMKEAAELSESSSSPSPHFCAHPVSDENLFDWHFTIAGPPAPSPYANGIYHGRIVLPPQYPLRPPSFRFLTPSGRFEVNREICLSISGHHEETWQPAWGIRTALIAIRSFMDADAKGQVGGLEAKEEVRREWAEKSRGWTCDVCFGGKKTNEQVLTEWREVCKRKGIVVDGDGGEREVVPDELKFDIKSDKESGNNDNNNNGQQGGPQREEHAGSVSSSQATVAAAGSLAPSSSSSNPNLPSSPATQQGAESSSSSKPTTQSPSTTATFSPQGRTPESTVQDHHLQPTRTTPMVTRQQVAVQSSDGPWLDRAIIGVVIALVFMILRKMSKTDAVV
ncbi:ubiquitin conjugating enzyme (UbcF), putative [Paecilomyces variotii No. 5]|uniref:Ubiquitin conjugating enzyme (UbcF), putative n=1 Tax=Byssochlamys spectabilis (strain No. 5 / NBRC 109023) TaxID=1356009 RepID=V5FZK9_BYSSN|nr:ubiquitin conjugating enzyme (UbcF), putative [Paecilomyces variotii No. 5]